MEVADVIVEDGKIAQVGEDLEVPSGAKIIDATDKFVMPGMWNMQWFDESDFVRISQFVKGPF